MSEAQDRVRAWLDEHLKTYVRTDGAEGHIIDLRGMGGREGTTALLLKTIGRRSGKPLVNPLIYGQVGDEYVVIGSKGGAPAHPAWYLNLVASPDVRFQIEREHFRGSWRIAEGDELRSIWDFMVDLFPPYAAYQQATDRAIPVVLLRPAAKVDAL
jgi:deazaflavin-dependent oxidoreductase (nitroreductase family)